MWWWKVFKSIIYSEFIFSVVWSSRLMSRVLTYDGKYWRHFNLPVEWGAPLETNTKMKMKILEERFFKFSTWGMIFLLMSYLRVLRVNENKIIFRLPLTFCFSRIRKTSSTNIKKIELGRNLTELRRVFTENLLFLFPTRWVNALWLFSS